MTDSTPATAALPPFCEVHGCRGRWDADQPHTLCGKATTTAARLCPYQERGMWFCALSAGHKGKHSPSPTVHPNARLKDLLAEREAAIAVAWLRSKAEQYGDVSLRNLAMYAEDGQA